MIEEMEVEKEYARKEATWKKETAAESAKPASGDRSDVRNDSDRIRSGRGN